MGCPHGVMIKALDCGIVVSEFEFQSSYNVHFPTNTLGKDMKSLTLPTMGYIASPLLFYEDGFSIKLPTKVDMSLNNNNFVVCLFLFMKSSFSENYSNINMNTEARQYFSDTLEFDFPSTTEW